MGTAHLGPCVQVFQLDAQNRALNPVHPAIPADHIMVILARLTVITIHGHAVLQIRVVGDDRAGLTAGT